MEEPSRASGGERGLRPRLAGRPRRVKLRESPRDAAVAPHGRHYTHPMFDYAARRRRLGERLEAEGIAALFLGPSADLEYLTGVERAVPSFGQPLYAHGWVTGAFFRPGA